MAKKASSDPYLNTIAKINKDSNSTSLQIQKLVNSANTLQMKYNTSEAQKARAWQERMSKNSHQYEVADLKKAGLNPVLSANQGAASYTTSSASADPESGANAASSLKGAQMSALTNLESSRMSSRATMDAAKMSAEAMQQAAYTSALATKYASDNSLKASKYKADLDYKASKYHTDMSAAVQREGYANQRWIMNNQNAPTWSAFVDKHLRKSGLTGFAYKSAKSVLDYGNGVMMLRHAPEKYFTNKNPKSISKDNFKLSKTGVQFVKNQLMNSEMPSDKKSQNLYVKSVCFGDKKAFFNLCVRTKAYRASKGFL